MARTGRNVPLILISGFRESGKSTLIRHLMKTRATRRWSVVADDGEIDLIAEIERAKNIEAADAILIECASNLEPYFIAEHLTMGDANEKPPDGVVVDTMVTVVDGSRVIEDLLKDQNLNDINMAFDSEDERTVAELLIEQIEFADVLLINKTDVMSAEKISELKALLTRLNPRAEVIQCEYGRVESEKIVHTRKFDLEKTDDGAGWVSELMGEFSSSDGGNGVSSFTFIDRRPFHPSRLSELLVDSDLNGTVRAKGHVWVGSRHNEIGIWSLAGKSSALSYGGAWFAATPAREWPTSESERMEIMQDWTAPFGDRRQEIAFIGLNMNEALIRERLEECLMTPNEISIGPEGWFALPDPLPDWHVEDESSWM